MSNTSKRLLTIMLIGGLCVHFSMVIIFAAPLQIKKQKISYISSFYCYPFFQQSWGLFVPAPNSERQLFVRYKTSNGWSEWEDILQQEYLHHRENRLAGNETIVLLLSNSTHYAASDMGGKQCVYQEMSSKKELQVLNHEINQYLKNKYELRQNTEYEVLITNKKSSKTSSSYFKFLKID